jgi:hypothetical protein
MPRLSLYHPQKSNNYRYIDRIVKEQYEVGGTDLLIHKYVGAAVTTGSSTDLTQPAITTPSASAIQDLLFLETRDRTYDAHIYRLRGHYNVQNLDFDLSQFGLFLNNDTIFITVHYNDMIDIIGRKLMVGDVFELPHLTDYHPLDDSIPVGLRRYYQVTDANFASEGFSQTWFAHLWRIKAEPLVNSQQFAEILNQPMNKDNYIGHYDPTKSYVPGYTVTSGGKVYTPIKDVPVGVMPPDPAYWQVDTNPTEASIIDTYQKNLDINDAVIAEALRLVPKSGYDTSNLYVVPTFLDNHPSPSITITSPTNGGPPLGQGSLIAYRSPRYTTAGYAIRLNHNAGHQLRPGMRVILGTGFVRTVNTDTNSGRVTPDLVLTATVGTTSNTGPYGTADNTYSTADQYPKFTVTATATTQNSSVVKVMVWSDDLVVGLEVSAMLYSSNRSLNRVWPVGTTITAIDKSSMTFTTSNPTATGIVAGTRVEVASNFTGNISSVMDYRADCDPRFQYIKRASPRSFGYLNGYLTGDGTAPNGEPAGSGDTFPAVPVIGEYFLRTDYMPQRMFRWDGKVWREISRNVRTRLGIHTDSATQLASFVNESGRTNDATGGTVPTRQSLSTALRIKPD